MNKNDKVSQILLSTIACLAIYHSLKGMFSSGLIMSSLYGLVFLILVGVLITIIKDMFHG